MVVDAIRKFHKNPYFASADREGFLIVPNDNLGLTFDRFVPQIECPGRDIKKKNLDALSNYRMAIHPDLRKSYQYAFDKWTAAVKGVEKENKAISFDITSLTKVIFGFGNDSALEVGVHLNKPWGVPYISGSAIKGVVASYLRKTKTLDEGSPDYVNIFGGIYGEKDYSGAVVFNDAWLYPDCDSWFERDIINPHYQQYYSENRLPDGMDDPVPVQTLVLRPGLSFFVSMQGPENLLKYLKNALKEALCEGGIGAGAKTAVGYGRFKVVESEEERKKLEESVRKPKIVQETVGVAAERPGVVAPRGNFQKRMSQPKISTFPIEVVAPIKGQTKKGKWQVCVNIKDKDTLIAISNSDAVPADKGIDSEIRVKVFSVAMAEYLP